MLERPVAKQVCWPGASIAGSRWERVSSTPKTQESSGSSERLAPTKTYLDPLSLCSFPLLIEQYSSDQLPQRASLAAHLHQRESGERCASSRLVYDMQKAKSESRKTSALGAHSSVPDIIASKSPLNLQHIDLSAGECDKAFASCWISDDEVLLTTKCRRLILLNTQTRRRIELPVVGDSLGYVAQRAAWDRSIASSASDHSSDSMESTGSNLTQPAGDESTSTTLASRMNSCGIRCLAINEDRTVFATGAADPNSVAFYSLPSFEPILLGQVRTRSMPFFFVLIGVLETFRMALQLGLARQ